MFSSVDIQAGYGRLIPIRDGTGVRLIGYNPSSPGAYSEFDPNTLESTKARPFNDSLKIDYASNSPVLDSDGVSYHGERTLPQSSIGARAGLCEGAVLVSEDLRSGSGQPFPLLRLIFNARLTRIAHCSDNVRHCALWCSARMKRAAAD